MTVGERIKSLRESKKITQSELANIAGTTKQNIYKYETGIITNIPSDKVELIAKYFHVSPAYIMGWEEKEWRIDPELNEGCPIPPGPHYSRMKEKLLSLSVKLQQAKDSAITIPIIDIDNINSNVLDLTFGSDYDFAPLITNNIEHIGTLIYVRNNTKYEYMKNKMYPLIDENDIILLDYGATPINGDIVIIELVPGKCFVCRYFRFDTYIELQYPSMRSEQINQNNPDFTLYQSRGVVKQIIKNV